MAEFSDPDNLTPEQLRQRAADLNCMQQELQEERERLEQERRQQEFEEADIRRRHEDLEREQASRRLATSGRRARLDMMAEQEGEQVWVTPKQNRVAAQTLLTTLLDTILEREPYTP